MCELLGMECNVPTDIVFSFTGLRRRGGGTAHHKDGWGLALYQGKRARVFLDPEPAARSPLAAFVAENPIKTLLAIGHIRKKTRGPRSLANTHPFSRELWGRDWVFAHNGTVKDADSLRLGRYAPIGSTGSDDHGASGRAVIFESVCHSVCVPPFQRSVMRLPFGSSA